MTSAIILAMNQLCRGNGVYFAVILLPQAGAACWPPSIVATLVKGGVPFLDLSDVPFEGLPRDGHPTVDEHARIAAAIADSFLTEVLQDETRPELH